MSKHKTVIERSLFSLTWPIFIDILFVFLINVVDAWFLSRISDTAAAAVGAVLPIAAMSFTFLIALNTAGCAVASQRLGAQNTLHLEKTYGALMWLCALAGCAIAFVLLTFASTFASVMGLTGETADYASIYLHTLGYGVLFLGIRFGASAVLQSQGKTHWNMVATGAMTLVNLTFNALLIDGKWGLPALGVQGIAIATCLAWGTNLLVSLWAIRYRARIDVSFIIAIADLKRWLRPILKIAVPSALEPLSWHISQLVIISMVVSLGDTALAARVYAFNLIFIVVLFTSALSAGVQLKVTHLYGARDYTTMHRELHKGIYLGLIVVTVMVGLLYLAASSLLGLFTTNPDIVILGTTVIGLAILCETGRLLNMLVGFSIKTTGNAKFVATFGIATMWFMSVPLTWLLGIHWGYGLAGIWVAMGIDEVFRGCVSLAYWNRRQRLHQHASLTGTRSPIEANATATDYQVA
ncbi:MAG TPA: MATE family efflux transporter [Marinagarivorans sp.]